MGNESSYTPGNCTWFVADQLSWIPAGLGDAGDWFANATAKGLKTSNVPVTGSVVVYKRGGSYSPFGHVGIVTNTANFRGTGGTFSVSEMNLKGLGVTDTRESTTDQVLGFILPPGSPGARDLGNLGQDATQAVLGPIGDAIKAASGDWLNTILYGAEIVFGGVLALITVAIMILAAFSQSSAAKTAANFVPGPVGVAARAVGSGKGFSSSKKAVAKKDEPKPKNLEGIPARFKKRRTVAGPTSKAEIARDRKHTRAVIERHREMAARKKKEEDEIPF